MRVLVVEDDRALGLFLERGLKLEGHEVAWVGDGDAAVDYVMEHRLDLMVLDLGLPKRDGLDVLQALQGLHGGMAILVLTGRVGIEDRISSLNLGADDCMMKPFSFHELIARCRALERRRAFPVDSVLRHDDLTMDRMHRKVQRGGEPVDLTVKEFALLEYLLLHHDRCVSRKELLAKVWSMAPEAGTNVVDVYVNYLRKKLEPKVASLFGVSSLIETVRGEGYRLRAMKNRQQREKTDERGLEISA
ncbi:response regulator transcription factor [Terriglobus saanensis]|uniref:Two component transcriptional regulator, winged helix family n=1 Tax=Terriglobus saanensis (strain ATCC BAA-1853 / DSM 23119 / SP1PR4) TaxID=401053 RepID=E8V4Y4_TERSS|nr:response regulator transcription factor [Terriglobus saanensis]ADV82612.1 two component transcriptional regulator, winged helix family [Terriglobus saanensis SP1PR4]